MSTVHHEPLKVEVCKDETYRVVLPEGFIVWPVGDEYFLSDASADLEVRLLSQDGNMGIPATAKVKVFRQMPYKPLNALRKYVADHTTNKSDHENRFLGPRWVVICRREKPRYVAFGCNVWRLDESERTFNDNKDLLAQLDEAIENRKAGAIKTTFWSLLAVVMLLSLVVLLRYESKFGRAGPTTEPRHIIDPPTLTDLVNDGGDTGVWKFYKYHFPDVYGWCFDEKAGTPKYQLSKQLLDPMYIQQIWNHVHNPNFLKGKPEDERAAAMCRLVLYDLFTNNQAFKDSVAANDGPGGMLNGTSVEIWQKLLTFPPTHVFYLQAGNLNIKPLDLQTLATEHHVSLPPPDSRLSEFCDKPEEILIHGRLTDLAHQPASIKKGNAKLDDWVAVHLTTTEADKKESLVFFYKDGPTVLQGRATTLLDDAAAAKNLVQEWYSIPEAISTSLGLKGREGFSVDLDFLAIDGIRFQRAKELLSQATKIESPPQIVPHTKSLIKDPTGVEKGVSLADPISAAIFYNLLGVGLSPRNIQRLGKSQFDAQVLLLSSHVGSAGGVTFNSLPEDFKILRSTLEVTLPDGTNLQFQDIRDANTAPMEEHLFNFDGNSRTLYLNYVAAGMIVHVGNDYLVENKNNEWQINPVVK